MVFTIVIARAGQAPRSALQFLRAALAKGHAVRQVFFLGDACSEVRGDAQQAPLADLRDLAADHGFALLACQTQLERRNLLTAHDGPIQAGTLGQLAIAFTDSDRTVTFK